MLLHFVRFSARRRRMCSLIADDSPSEHGVTDIPCSEVASDSDAEREHSCELSDARSEPAERHSQHVAAASETESPEADEKDTFLATAPSLMSRRRENSRWPRACVLRLLWPRAP